MSDISKEAFEYARSCIWKGIDASTAVKELRIAWQEAMQQEMKQAEYTFSEIK